MVMDALHSGDHTECLRLLHESPDAVRKHAACRDEAQTAWLHFAVRRKWLDVVELILQGSTGALELISSVHGKPIAEAVETGSLAMLHLLIKYGADTQSPCTKAARNGSGWTPLQLTERPFLMLERGFRERLSGGSQSILDFQQPARTCDHTLPRAKPLAI